MIARAKMSNRSEVSSRFLRGVGVPVLMLLAMLSAQASSVGPDTFGYMANDATAYSFVDVASTGIGVLAGADDDKAVVNIGFPFTFYGQSYTSACVSTNGLLSFGGCNSDFANQDLTATGPSGNLPTIAPFWFDLSFAVKGAGAIYYQTMGPPGDRQFIVQWNNAYPINAAKGVTFQVVLYESGSRILFQYKDVNAGTGSPASFGAGATVGIRDVNGQANGRRLQWSHKAPVLRNNQAILLFARDTIAPVIAGMPKTGCTLWPPDDKLVQVALVTASDAASGLASFTVTGTSNEPPDKDPAIIITGGANQYTIQLRASRLGTGTGRVYTLNAVAKDMAGNTATASATCTVPHDLGTP